MIQHIGCRHSFKKTTIRQVGKRMAGHNATSTGQKQLHVARVFFNADRMLRCERNTYLVQSAAFMRARLPNYNGQVAKACHLVLDKEGLFYVSGDEIVNEKTRFCVLVTTTAQKDLPSYFSVSSF